MTAATLSPRPRVDWVDTAKGLSIALVVTMHATLGVEQAMGAEGFMHAIVAFAAPFRMPAFFLIAGLFLARAMTRDTLAYLDGKVVHFAWFYAVWALITLLVKGVAFGPLPLTALPAAWAMAFIEPLGTLWFIYLLPVFFVVARLLARVPTWPLIAVAALLELAPVSIGHVVIDETAARFVYFVLGWRLAPQVFALAQSAAERPRVAALVVLVFGLGCAGFVSTGSASLPVISLYLGVTGAACLVVLAVLLAKLGIAAPVAFLGRHSLVIYLAFFLPMVAARMVLLQTGLITDPGLVSLIVTVAALLGPLALHAMVKRTPARFLFERPAFVTLKQPRLRPAA
jgi:uncharacterized membrane protein YcfT